MIVVDTNVIAYLLIPGQYTNAARASLTRDPEWAAPMSWRSEFRNVLALYMRRGELSLRRATALQEAAEELLAGREHLVASSDVLALAIASGRSAYDCEFIAVARQLSRKLVTSDRPLLASFPDDTVALSAFATDVADL
ncbi:MAG: type II toxin-antitoxin system VapC family toxin [bacterium]